MKYKYYFPAAFTFLFALVFTKSSYAQDTEQKIMKHILHKDSLFWQSYNRCDTSGYDQFFSNDVEFYHDKGGITLGADNMALSLKKNLCSNSDFRIRREEVKGTVKVFTLQNNGVIYGVILSGEHFFYISEKGKTERLDGRAKFTHLWLLKDGVWKMTRILSYDHGPANR
jgi:Domain of unknown function (DUF4440)